MTRAIFSFAYATTKHAWSTRAIAWLAIWATIPAVFFASTLRADRTITGAQTMILTYAPIAIFAVLLIGSIWLSAFTLSSERMHMQFAMLRTKPVHGVAIWTGKWLGVLIIMAIALAIAIATFFITMTIRFQGHPIARIPVWNVCQPDETVIHDQAYRILQKMERQAETTDHHIPSLRQIVNRLRQQQYRVGPGTSTSWHIPLDWHDTPHAKRQMQFQWRLDPMRRAPVTGTWTLSVPDEASPLSVNKVSGLVDGHHTISLPELDIPTGTPYLIVTFHAAPDNEPQIFFDHKSPVSLKQQSGILAFNLMRAATLMFVLCAAVAAITLLFSSFFSFPVTVFTTHGVIFALLITAIAGRDTPHIRHSHGHHHGHNENWLLTQTEHFLDAIYHLTSSLRSTLPFRYLSENMQISFRDHAAILLILMVLLPLSCAWCAHYKMMHEEVVS